MKPEPLSDKEMKSLAQTRARSIYWAAYGVAFSLFLLPLIVFAIQIGDHYRPYVTGTGIVLASFLAQRCAKAAVKRIKPQPDSINGL